MCGMLPPIGKMDASLSTLKQCNRLSISTNVIDKITSLSGMGAHAAAAAPLQSRVAASDPRYTCCAQTT